MDVLIRTLPLALREGGEAGDVSHPAKTPCFLQACQGRHSAVGTEMFLSSLTSLPVSTVSLISRRDQRGSGRMAEASEVAATTNKV